MAPATCPLLSPCTLVSKLSPPDPPPPLYTASVFHVHTSITVPSIKQTKACYCKRALCILKCALCMLKRALSSCRSYRSSMNRTTTMSLGQIKFFSYVWVCVSVCKCVCVNICMHTYTCIFMYAYTYTCNTSNSESFIMYWCRRLTCEQTKRTKTVSSHVCAKN